MPRSKPVKRKGAIISRSGLERSIRQGLDKAKVPYEYEAKTFSFPLPENGYTCGTCASNKITKRVRYTPDFRLSESLYVEAKGRFSGSNRRRLLAFKAAYPDIDLRLVFQRDNALSKSSKTRYSEWAKDNGFTYHVGPEIPKGWLR